VKFTTHVAVSIVPIAAAGRQSIRSFLFRGGGERCQPSKRAICLLSRQMRFRIAEKKRILMWM
jgi:hypothetical protein